ERRTVDDFKDDRWSRPILAGDVVPAVVVAAPKTGAARLRIGRYHADLEKAGYAWTRRTSAADLFKPGDLVDVSVTKIDDATQTATGRSTAPTTTITSSGGRSRSGMRSKSPATSGRSG